MLTDLHLKGNELIVYAVIYGYTQDGQHWYYGTRGHLAEWCGATKGTVTNCLNSLVKKGYIERREVEKPGRTEIQYQAKNCPTLPKIVTGGNKNYEGGSAKISSFNIKDNNKEDKGDSCSRKEKKPKSFPCKCGGTMHITACRQTGTGKPYYRCDDCGTEKVL